MADKCDKMYRRRVPKGKGCDCPTLEEGCVEDNCWGCAFPEWIDVNTFSGRKTLLLADATEVLGDPCHLEWAAESVTIRLHFNIVQQIQITDAFGNTFDTQHSLSGCLEGIWHIYVLGDDDRSQGYVRIKNCKGELKQWTVEFTGFSGSDDGGIGCTGANGSHVIERLTEPFCIVDEFGINGDWWHYLVATLSLGTYGPIPQVLPSTYNGDSSFDDHLTVDVVSMVAHQPTATKWYQRKLFRQLAASPGMMPVELDVTVNDVTSNLDGSFCLYPGDTAVNNPASSGLTPPAFCDISNVEIEVTDLP